MQQTPMECEFSQSDGQVSNRKRFFKGISPKASDMCKNTAYSSLN